MKTVAALPAAACLSRTNRGVCQSVCCMRKPGGCQGKPVDQSLLLLLFSSFYFYFVLNLQYVVFGNRF